MWENRSSRPESTPSCLPQGIPAGDYDTGAEPLSGSPRKTTEEGAEPAPPATPSTPPAADLERQEESGRGKARDAEKRQGK